MSLNKTPQGERIHIGFFGNRNAGKSSLVNALTGQELSVVSDTKGTTTDPVYKSMEILPLGPVTIIDTPGFDDTGSLGELRVKKTKEILRRTDIAILVVDLCNITGDKLSDILNPNPVNDITGKEEILSTSDLELIDLFDSNKIPYLIVFNKVDAAFEKFNLNQEKPKILDNVTLKHATGSDDKYSFDSKYENTESVNKDVVDSKYDNEKSINHNPKQHMLIDEKSNAIKENLWKIIFGKTDTKKSEVNKLVLSSSKTGFGIETLKESLSRIIPEKKKTPLIADLITSQDVIVLVIPIDESAPKGRIILPQQQVLREILDCSATAVVIKETELKYVLNKLNESPRLVVTDSQVFGYVSSILPENIPLTSFSILMARYKGFLETAIKGAAVIDKLEDDDTVLIAEGCTHHRQCNDIGTVKIPKLLKKYTEKNIKIETSSGRTFPEDLSKYKLVIHCGGCMLNEKEVQYRMKYSLKSGVPFLNYGTFIATATGILKRSIKIFE